MTSRESARFHVTFACRILETNASVNCKQFLGSANDSHFLTVTLKAPIDQPEVFAIVINNYFKGDAPSL